jgi:hypothetical protein
VEIIATTGQPRDRRQSVAVDPRSQIGMALGMLLQQIHLAVGKLICLIRDGMSMWSRSRATICPKTPSTGVFRPYLFLSRHN